MRGQHNAEVVVKPHHRWHVHSYEGEWRRRVEQAIVSADAQPPTHGPDLSTPISQLRDALGVQASLAALEFRRAMKKETP